MVSTMSMWVRMRDGKDVPLHLSKADQLRLLKYRTWMFRYYLPVQEILDLTIPILRQQIRRKYVKRKYVRGLGVSVAALTGAGAERILQEQIRKTYPDSEHITIWRERERDRQLAVERAESLGGMPETDRGLRLSDCATPEIFMARYERRLQRLRLEAAEADNPQRRKRQYRFNPW